jgi:hypothetical protein
MKTINLDTLRHTNQMRVIYADRETVARQYREAILALDMDEKKTVQYCEMDRVANFRSELEAQLRKTKLWDYAPEQREAVKAARTFLTHFLDAEIPYGETQFVPCDEAEAFLEDEVRMLGVESYQPAIGHRIAQAGQSVEHRLETLARKPLHALHDFSENMRETLVSPVALLSA